MQLFGASCVGEHKCIAEAFQIFKFFEPEKQRSLSEASGTLCGGAEKLRKSKNGAAARVGSYAEREKGDK